MKKDMLSQAMSMNKKRKYRKGWQSFVRTLALCVVFCTTYVLILPAITMQEDPVCGFEEHTHGEECFIQPQVGLLNCEIPEGAGIVHQHNERCYNENQELICTLPEQEAHIHDLDCFSMEEEPVACPVTHVHDDVCTVTESVLICTLEETPIPQETQSEEAPQGHVHGEECYEVRVIPCTQPTAEDHDHDISCYILLTCEKPEVQLHSHGEGCYDEESNLICTVPEVVEHIHTDACQVIPEDAAPVLVCGKEEHTHTPECYPVEEEPTLGLEFTCGYAVHTHVEGCYAEDGTLTCSIPEHTHEAACAVEDLDLTADVETAADWDALIEKLQFNGIWAEDLLKVAESQLGYAESSRNCVLENECLMGYTRYGAWYGIPYGEWDDMFVSFCLHYAEITEEYIPYESDTLRWIEKLTQKGLYAAAGDYTPVAGDLIFWDSDGDDGADKSGIVTGITEAQNIKVITGDTEENVVAVVSIAAGDEAVIGFAKLPVNPMSPEQWAEAEAVSAMLAQLPEPETLRKALEELNLAGDKAGYDALVQEAAARMEAAETAYNTLNEAQQARITGLERLDALKVVLEGLNWQEFAVLTDDSAALIQLSVDDAQIIHAPVTGEVSEEEPEIPEGAFRNLDTVCYTFTGITQSYYTDVSYGAATVKVELVLPLTEDKALFDMDSLSWLENSTLTVETRLINEEEVLCQVLTGYKKLVADDTDGIVVPGSFTESVRVKAVNLTHGECVVLIISAAMEHNTWEGICEAHQRAEKLTVVTDAFTVYAPQDPETQQANYEAFLLEAEEIEARNLSDSDQYFTAQELMQRIAESYNTGGLNDEQFEALSAVIAELSNVNMNAIAEPCIGTNWMKNTNENILYGGESEVLTDNVRAKTFKITTAMSSVVYNTVFPSSQQIDEVGGAVASDDGAVMVSKTIEGTDIENVFDITLQIVTRDEVNEVYEDPDMAVVVVMDISNTMRSDFGSTTRYKAAMTAGENFLKKFAEQNSTLSRVGYVAFNTSAHEIFDLSPCNTTAQASSLTSTMKSKTGTIINAAGYEESVTRFTNMEAGLKMAYDMLKDANNRHKYIIFISDGFPTTYVKSGYTGYDPNCSSGTKDTDGVFYDDALNKWCLYGTSYSDTAAIKARKLAVSLKDQGVNIFSIGVDVGGQTLSRYHAQSVNTTASDLFSTVERRNEASYYRSNGYEIGIDHDILWEKNVPTIDEYNANPGKYPEWTAQINIEAGHFKNWLKGSATTGIGSGYYYDSTNLEGLNAAYEEIFQKILELNASSAHLDWVAADPMSDMGVHEVQAMEFISFWDLDENGDWVMVVDNLTGESRDGNLYDNTADFHEDTQTIHWDIKKSGYISQVAGNSTTYLCELKYRVRLRNEESVFVENEVYDTNDVTTLTYRIIEVDGEDTYVSEQRTINFPIPAVHGYLSELNFKKVTSTGYSLEGAEFTLSHDTDNCGFCRGDGENHVAVPDKVDVSDGDGLVSFTQIPSGHTYTLTETRVPDGFLATGNTYQVTVSYDALTVTVTDADGNPVTWEGTINNRAMYVLPNTGGIGTSPFTFGGLLILAAAMMYILNFGRKRQKGGRDQRF